VVTDDELAEVISSAADNYFAEVDPEDADTDDLAWTIVHAMKRAAGKPKFPPGLEIAPGVHYVSKGDEG
jgi:hypothetical protein